MTTAFVLSGGGSLGAVQVGMLAALTSGASALTSSWEHRSAASTPPDKEIA